MYDNNDDEKRPWITKQSQRYDSLQTVTQQSYDSKSKDKNTTNKFPIEHGSFCTNIVNDTNTATRSKVDDITQQSAKLGFMGDITTIRQSCGAMFSEAMSVQSPASL